MKKWAVKLNTNMVKLKPQKYSSLYCKPFEDRYFDLDSKLSDAIGLGKMKLLETRCCTNLSHKPPSL